MSEFFKALEQAERDREVAERNEQSATVPEPQTSDQAASLDELAGLRAAPAVEPVPPAPAPPPVTPTPAPPPGDGRRTSVFDRPPAVPRPPMAPVREREAVANRAAIADASVAADRVAVPHVERSKPVEERMPSRPVERPAPAPIPPAAPAAAERPASRIESDPKPLHRVTTPPKRRSDTPVLIADLEPRSVAAEAYRTLRANLEFMPSERGYRNIVFTSPSMGEGKSTTVANLAIVAAQAGSRVCLVDADMRRPTLHKVFGVPNRGGFTRALSQAMPLASVAVPTAMPNLSLVVAGSADGLRPAQLLNAPRLQKVLHDPTTPFDLVLFDTPPIISVADAMNLAAHCDGVVLVVRAGAVPPSVLQQAVRQVDQVKGKVLGVLLNQVDLHRGDAEFYRYYRAYYNKRKED